MWSVKSVRKRWANSIKWELSLSLWELENVKTYLRRNWISSRFSRPPRDERIARKTTARNTIPAPPAPATSFWSMAMTIAATLTLCVHWKITILTTHSSHSIAFQFRVWLSNTGYFIWIPLIEKFNQLHPSALFCFKELVHKCQSKMRKKSSEKVKSYMFDELRLGQVSQWQSWPLMPRWVMWDIDNKLHQHPTLCKVRTLMMRQREAQKCIMLLKQEGLFYIIPLPNN